MQHRSLYAKLYLFGDRDEREVRSKLETIFQCTFEERYAKSDEYGTVTWFSDTFGFEFLFRCESRRDNGAWYVMTLTPKLDVEDTSGPMEEINSHVALMLRASGFELVVDRREYVERYELPEQTSAAE